MEIRITIQDDNDAFQLEGKTDLPTVALNLHEVCRRIADGERSGRLRDVNGNTAISFQIFDGE